DVSMIKSSHPRRRVWASLFQYSLYQKLCCEGGMMPGVAFYLSTYYKRDELVFRIGVFCNLHSQWGFWRIAGFRTAANPTTKRAVSCNCYALLIEGAITIALGLAGFYFLPGSAKSRFLKQREKMIAVQRLVQDENNGNTAVNICYIRSTHISNRSIPRDHKQSKVTLGICFLFDNVVVQGISLFMPTLMKNMGYSTIQSQLRTVPPYVAASVFAIAVAYGSPRSGRRGVWLLLLAPLVIAGLAILLGTANNRANYAAIFLIAMGAFPQGPMLLSWVTPPLQPNTVRAVTSALVAAIGTIGPIMTSWIYLPGDS
ncbi:hypothetical protein RSAG8_09394, partial [Rhizoctonia solani AG-8 WAC10335]